MKHIKLFEEYKISEEDKKTFEITDTNGMDKAEATKTISDHYYDLLTYRGNEFFDKIYMGILIDFAADELGIGEKHYDEDEETDVTKDGQESYLGYLPDEDVFIEGYDVFGDAGNNVVFIKLDDKLEPTNVSNERKFHFNNPGSMMYGRGGGSLGALHSKFPTLIDIRLD